MKIKTLLLLSFAGCQLFAGAANAVKYDAFTAEAKGGLDHVSVMSKGLSPEGDLGREVYKEKVRDGYDVFVPTTNYVRMGARANLAVIPGFRIGGAKNKFEFGAGPEFAFGWNILSWARAEFGWNNSYLWFKDANASVDSGNLMLYFDLARRSVMRGDITWRRKLIPFFGVGGIAGYASFDDDETMVDGKSAWTYGARGVIGLSFAFTETNALDLSVSADYLSGNGFGWDDPKKEFGNLGVSLSWRSSF